MLKCKAFSINNSCWNTGVVNLLLRFILRHFVVFLAVFPISLFAFTYPPVTIYGPEQYKGGNQNWKIAQLSNNDIVFANEKGLLIFNGEQWKIYKSHLSTVVRSVHVFEDILYSGGYMDFGFWSRKRDGKYEYTSLVEKYELTLRVDEQIWNIVSKEDKVIFQTLSQLYIYDTRLDKFEVISPPSGVNKIFDLGKEIYFQTYSRDIYRLGESGIELFYEGSLLPNSEIINMFYAEDGIKIFIKENGFYHFKEGEFIKWIIPDQGILELGDFFSAEQLENGDFVLGSITRGVLILSEKGELKIHLHQMNGLSNNTVLSVFEDRNNNIWLGLDNGINTINPNSPFSEYIDKTGILGTVYCSQIHNDILYLGTNQGLFFRKQGSNEEFKLVKNSNGQIWSLFLHDDKLFCGHNLGTYIIEGDRARKISDILGTWKFSVDEANPSILFQGNYEGLHVLKKQDGLWKYGWKIKGLDFSARQFEYKDHCIYLYHLSFGFVKMVLDVKNENILEKKLLKEVRPGYITSVINNQNSILFSDSDGLFRVDDKDELKQLWTSKQDIVFSRDLPKLVSDKTFFWMLMDDAILQLKLNQNDSLEILSDLPIDPEYFNNKDEYENISKVGDESYLLGLTNGYFIVDYGKIGLLNQNYDVAITVVEMKQHGKVEMVNLNESGEFSNTQNSFTLYYNVPKHIKFQDIEYKYILEGESETWTSWKRENQVSFHKLKPGKYKFRVQARVSKILSQNIAEYSFQIKQPWYWSIYSIIAYSILLLLTALTINYFYSRLYQKRQEQVLLKSQKEMHFLKLENEQELMKVRNEQLKAEIDAKNKEMAVTAMSVVKKNEFLIGIRDIMSKQEEKDEKFINALIVSINKEIENEESWEMLKNAFENVDKEFIKKLLSTHPGLTPSDLKLSTYLRLNLSSKEIASLLNISVRSMETKRYRLRKKLGLEHNTNLTEYILSI